MRSFFNKLFLVLMISITSALAHAESVASLGRRAQDAADIIEDVVSIRDNKIPISLLEQAVCVATIPDVIRVGFVFGGRYGKGLVACRTATGWSLPSYLYLRGGSWGAQIGVEAVDLVLVFVRSNAIEKFSKDNFTIGVDASVAAGPVGRDARIGTDYQLESEIYSYSKTRGIFAGLAIQGTSLSVDKKDNQKVYGDVSARDLLTSFADMAPATVSPYIYALDRFTY